LIEKIEEIKDVILWNVTYGTEEQLPTKEELQR